VTAVLRCTMTINYTKMGIKVTEIGAMVMFFDGLI
jgi:hypothetical protein